MSEIELRTEGETIIIHVHLQIHVPVYCMHHAVCTVQVICTRIIIMHYLGICFGVVCRTIHTVQSIIYTFVRTLIG